MSTHPNDGLPCPACGSTMGPDMSCPNLRCPNHNDEPEGADACTKCGGAGKVELADETVETCERCEGTGVEPQV